ncbi:MAG: glutamate racemase [Acaryochloridaceae cyanobacterium SU_2_1]|nr:glutamate racemase [Acaryochloridaceae cyanobacterium SU_2_1]NJM95499.1 glutamate racemase [Acaryochloridaceae cyanobacterium CSU_5_19]
MVVVPNQISSDLPPLSAGLSRDKQGYSYQPLPIGVFDSGVGGLTVLKELRRQLPHESFLYFGDTAHVPYGVRSQAEILHFSRQILAWMTQQPIKMAIMACNTSSALALDDVRLEFDVPVIGIILPGARAAVKQGRRIGVIATPATVASNSYAQAIQEIDPTIEVFQRACPEFVPLIESNKLLEPETLAVVRQHIQPLLAEGIDTLVYGCTHYPHLAPIIEPLLPEGVELVDPAVHMTKATRQELRLLQLQNSQPAQPPRFCVSGCPHQFAELSRQWLGFLPAVDRVILPELVTAELSPEPLEPLEESMLSGQLTEA